LYKALEAACAAYIHLFKFVIITLHYITPTSPHITIHDDKVVSVSAPLYCVVDADKNRELYQSLRIFCLLRLKIFTVKD